MATLVTLRARVRDLLNPSLTVEDSDIDAAITAAFVPLFALAPRTMARDVVLDADGCVDMATVAGWTFDSTLRTIEYPIGDFPITVVDVCSYSVGIDVNGDQILRTQGMDGETVRIFFSGLHSGATLGVMKVQVAEGLALLSAAEIMAAWAARWAQKGAMTVAGEDYQGPSISDARAIVRDFTARAHKALRRPFTVAGIDPGAGIALMP